MYKYQLTNSRRIDCPFCGKHGKYSAYQDTKTGQLAPMEYGMCSSCRQYKTPPNNFIPGEATYNTGEVGFFEADRENFNLQHFYKSKHFQSNYFFDGLTDRFGKQQVERVADLYRIGKFDDHGVIFPYYYTDDHLCTAKILFYDKHLSRVKDDPKRKYPKFTHNLYYNSYEGSEYDFRELEVDQNGNDVERKFNLRLSLFGHHLIINDREKTIGLVESEKTAIIMAIVFPEFIWVASGGKTMIQDYKFLFFTNRKCLVFYDLHPKDDIYLDWSEKLTFYSRKYGYDFELIDYYSDFLKNDKEKIEYWKNKQFDVADFVLYLNSDNKYVNYLKDKLSEKIMPY